jgi:uncharacterized protein (TIGR04255 family)
VTNTITYKNAPLVELIVEVRWSVQTQSQGGGIAIVADRSTSFQNLSNDLRGAGYHELERLIPHEMPAMAYHPVFRFKQQNKEYPIVHLGHGIFTVNAGPPDYISWKNFRPEVEKTLEILALHKKNEEPSNLFNAVRLRYIDVFKNDLRRDLSNFNFIKDVMGVHICLPEGLLDFAANEESISPTIALKIPIKDATNANLTFQLAAGRLAQSVNTDTIMDMTYAVNCEPTADTIVLLQHLDEAHDVINWWFTRLTTKLHDRMDPVVAS